VGIGRTAGSRRSKSQAGDLGGPREKSTDENRVEVSRKKPCREVGEPVSERDRAAGDDEAFEGASSPAPVYHY
jgi:hypothetical protein